jgi:hypothetical protein
VIKIRYADLPQGLHAQVRTAGRWPVIYLLPGLSPAQRRDALRRLIRTSRQGYGPRLRVSGVAFAVARDVTKSTARTGLAAVRGHPAGSAVLAAFLAAAVVCYSLFVTVTVRLSPGPAGPPAAAGAAPSGLRQSGGPGRSPGGGASTPAGTQPAATRPHGTSPSGAAGSGSSGSATSGPAPSGSVPPGSVPPGSVPSGSGPSGPGPTGPAASLGPVPLGTWSAPGGVLPSLPARAPGPAPAPSPSAAPPPASPGPRQTAHPGGLCLQLGPLGVCVSG